MPVGGQLGPDGDSNETSDRHQYPYMEKDIIVNNSKIAVFIRINSKERNERREGEREERGRGRKGREMEGREREGGKGERGRMLTSASLRKFCTVSCRVRNLR